MFILSANSGVIALWCSGGQVLIWLGKTFLRMSRISPNLVYTYLSAPTHLKNTIFCFDDLGN